MKKHTTEIFTASSMLKRWLLTRCDEMVPRLLQSMARVHLSMYQFCIFIRSGEQQHIDSLSSSSRFCTKHIIFRVLSHGHPGVIRRSTDLRMRTSTTRKNPARRHLRRTSLLPTVSLSVLTPSAHSALWVSAYIFL